MMQTYRGIVCEKKSTYMVFLTEKGEFLRGVPIGSPPEVGEEAEFTLTAPSFIAGGKAKPRFVGAVLVAAAVLFFMLSSLSPLNDKVMAYIQVDAGAAMEFGVDRKGNVVSMRYLNETQKSDLSNWRNHPILAVLDRAVSELPEPDGAVSITAIYPNRENERETRQMIEGVVQEVRVNHTKLNLEIAESTPEERKVANKKNMSIHQFKSIESKKKKHPVKKADPVEKKPVQPQKDNLQKPKKENGSPKPPQQKKMEKEDAPAEKNEKKPNNGRSDKVPPHADKKGPPPHSSSGNKHNQGPPAKQQKENPSNEKKENPQNNK